MKQSVQFSSRITLIIFIIISFSKCMQVAKPPPSAGPVTFLIYEPLNNNCFAHHQGPGAPTNKIRLKIILKTEYLNPRNAGADYLDYDNKDPVTFDPAINTWPISITANAPTSNPWYCQVDIQGIDCSECANSYGLPTEPSGMCSANQFLTNPPTYQGAIPRWENRFTFPNYVTTASLTPHDRIPNLPNTCNSGCIIN